MKLPLKDVLKIGQAMKQLEAGGLVLAAPDQVRWAVARKRVWEFVDPFVAGIVAEYEKGERNPDNFTAIQLRHLEEINGETVELTLPAPIRMGGVKELPCRNPPDYEALANLVGFVFEDITEG